MQRVVIYRLGSLGDTIVALPCFHKIAEVFPDAERIVLTNAPVSAKAPPLDAILLNSGLVHRTMAYPIRMRSAAGFLGLRDALRALHATTLIYLAPGRGRLQAYRDIVFFRWCGFTTIIGAPTTADLQVRRRDIARNATERECARLARTLAALGPIDVESQQAWDLRLTADEQHAGRESTRQMAVTGYVAINMGGKLRQKDWGEGNWRALLSSLTRSCPDFGLLIVGGAEDAARAAETAEVWRGNVVNACGRLSPRESAAALEGAFLFIGHDSGPLHLAAAMGVPCVGLFGDGNVPEEWHPPGACHRIIHRMAGVGTIAVADVVDAVHALLAMRQGAPVLAESLT